MHHGLQLLQALKVHLGGRHMQIMSTTDCVELILQAQVQRVVSTPPPPIHTQLRSPPGCHLPLHALRGVLLLQLRQAVLRRPR